MTSTDIFKIGSLFDIYFWADILKTHTELLVNRKFSAYVPIFKVNKLEKGHSW